MKDHVAWWRSCQRCHGQRLQRSSLSQLLADFKDIKKHLRFVQFLHSRAHYASEQIGEHIRTNDLRLVLVLLPWSGLGHDHDPFWQIMTFGEVFTECKHACQAPAVEQSMQALLFFRNIHC